MPIYEYQCAECGQRHEAIQKFSDQPLIQCPHCDKPGLKKLVSAASFRLKGGGWYETDFKTGNKKHVADSSSGEKSDKEDSGSSKKDVAKSGGKSAATSDGDSKSGDSAKAATKKSAE